MSLRRIMSGEDLGLGVLRDPGMAGRRDLEIREED